MQSKNKIQTRPIEDFIGQVRTAKTGQQKQIVLPIKDAERLADSLAQTSLKCMGIRYHNSHTIQCLMYKNNCLSIQKHRNPKAYSVQVIT